MTPEESLETRVGRLEVNAAGDRRDMAALAKRTDSLEMLMSTLAPLSTQVATLAVNVSDIRDDVNRVEGKFDKRWDKLEASQENARKDSRSLRNILIGVGIAAVLSPLAAFLFAAAVAKP